MEYWKKGVIDLRTIVIESFVKSGYEIAQKISQKTGMTFIDNRTILDEAEKLGADVAYLKPFEEKNFGSLIFSLFSNPNRFEQHSVHHSYNALAEAIRILHRKNKGGIFMGRFAAAILSELEPVCIAYVYSAPINLSKYYLSTSNTAKPLDVQRQHPQEKKIFSIHDEDVYYDIILNTNITSVDECAKTIIRKANT